MRSFLIIASDPFREIGLWGVGREIELLAERDAIELVQQRPLSDSIRLRAFYFSQRMVDVFRRDS